MNFIKTPNLPHGNINIAITAPHPPLLEFFNNKGIKFIALKANDKLHSALACHADMLLHHLGGNRLITAADIHINGIHCEKPSRSLSKEYPNDVLLNAARIGDFLVTRVKSTEPKIISYCKENGIKILDVKQGYAKCSTLIVDKKSIVTADVKIAEICDKNGIEPLLISHGEIELKGFDTGFIGGCGFLLNRQTLLFTGELKSHPDGEKIKTFTAKRNINIISVDKGKLVDIGGGILL